MENINKYDLLKVVDIIHNIGASKKHIVTVSYSTTLNLPLRVFVHNLYPWGESKNVCDDRAIFRLGNDDIEWLSYWKSVIEKEREDDESA